MYLGINSTLKSKETNYFRNFIGLKQLLALKRGENDYEIEFHEIKT
jgi:hypothetical protein